MNIALIVFAGSGTRIHTDIPKQFYKIKDVELVVYTIKKFNENPHIDEIVLVAPKEYIPYVECFKDKYGLDKIVKVISGGESRQESVRLGLSSIEYSDKDNILIHDGDRPLVSHAIINQAVESLKEFDVACPYLPLEEAIVELSNSGRRAKVDGVEVHIQTPQSFKFGLIKDLHLDKQDLQVNDDISFVDPERIKFYLGDPLNFKVTTDEDLKYLEDYLSNL